MKFITLTESRKDRETGKMGYQPVKVNTAFIIYIQQGRPNTYISFANEKFMFVKETYEEIEKLMVDKPLERLRQM